MVARKTPRLIGVVLALALLLTMVVGMAQAQEDVLVIGWEQEPPLLSPRSDMAFASLLLQFYGRDLWNWDTNRQIYPVMAAEIPTVENGLVTTNDAGNTVVTYQLREGLVWSDGEPITADDCLFWHEVTMNPTALTFQRGNYPDVVESLVKVDDYTLTLTYNRPWPDYQFDSTATCGFPEHILRPVLETEGTLDNAAYWSGQNTVGYGPYVLSEWNIGSGMTFDLNPNWDGETPGFERLVIRFILDSAQMLNALEAGEIDVAFNFSDDLLESYGAVPDAFVYSTDGVFGDAIWMNMGNGGHPALTNPDVRKAIIHAIDRETIARELVSETAGVPKAWFPEQFWPEDLGFIEYNPEGAAELLDTAGWVDADDNPSTPRVAQGVEGVSDGFPLLLRFYTTTRQIRMDYQVVIQEYLNDVGVGTQLLPVPANLLFADFLERGILDTGAFDLAIFALSSNPLSPSATAPEWFGCEGIPTPEQPNGNNGWGFCDSEYDRLDLEGASIVDPVERLAVAQQAITRFYEGQFWHGLYLRQTHYAFDTTTLNPDTVQDLGTLASNYFNKIELWQPAG